MKTFIALLMVVGASATVASGAVIYRETFSATQDAAAVNTTGSGAGWIAAGGNWKFAAQAGKPQDLSNVNAGLTTAPTLNPSGQIANGFLWNDTSSGASLIYTDEYVINTTMTLNLSTFSWYQGNADTSTGSRVAVQIAGSWYASEELFNNSSAVSSGGNFGNASGGAVLMSFDWTTQASNWYDLTVSGSTVTLGGAVRTEDLPPGDITAFGLYFNNRTATQRFDTFQIEAVPEPASVSLIGCAGLLALLRRRRR